MALRNVPAILLTLLLYLISPAAGTLFLSLPNAVFAVNENTTLYFRREPQDPRSLIFQTSPPSINQILVTVVDATEGTVPLSFPQPGFFSIQAVDANDPTILLQETPHFTVELARDPPATTISSSTTTPVFTTTHTTTPSSTPSGNSSSGSRSKAIAIGVVMGILFLLLLLVILYVCIRRRNRDRPGRRFTFHRSMMISAPIFNAEDDYAHYDPPPSDLPRFAQPPQMSEVAPQPWVARSPAQSQSQFVRAPPRITVTTDTPTRMANPEFLIVPPLNKRVSDVSSVGPSSVSTEEPTSAVTVQSADSTEIRLKMRNGLDTLKQVRGNVKQLPPIPFTQVAPSVAPLRVERAVARAFR